MPGRIEMGAQPGGVAREAIPVIDSLTGEARPPAFTDEALALRFAERHAGDLRYVAAWSQWLRWTGVVWQRDETLFAFSEARKICREASAECNDSRLSPSLASAPTVAAVERLARADRRLAATVDQWDMDPWLLNTPGGVVDLRTGDLRAHQPDDYVTKITAVAPGGDCPWFMRFLGRTTDKDFALQQYLQRALGYALTGITREHALFFAYGVGANGKSVLFNTVADVLGDYHRAAPIETFVASIGDRHPTEIAGLRGARVVTASETDEGRPWAEAKIKALTGGDMLSARFMKQDFFDFRPVFKLFVAGNHKPALRSVDEAMRRRFHVVPFSVTIPAGERDPQLTEKLRAEWPGILAWMIEGCLAWQREGLAPPPSVRSATDDYLRDEDSVAEWIGECCTQGPNVSAGSSELFASWSAWATRAGEPVGSHKRLSEVLQKRGFAKGRGGGAGRTVFRGIALRTQPGAAGMPPAAEGA